MSDSLRPHGLQPARLLSPPLSPTVFSNLCPLSQWCYLTKLFSAAPFSFCPQSLPASGSFPVSLLFQSSGQRIGASASASVLPMNIQSWFPLSWVVWSCSSRDSQESSPAPQFESINFSVLSLLYDLTLTSVHDYWKNHSFNYMDLCQQRDVSAFYML